MLFLMRAPLSPAIWDKEDLPDECEPFSYLLWRRKIHRTSGFHAYFCTFL
jgi:hypothetical protein